MVQIYLGIYENFMMDFQTGWCILLWSADVLSSKSSPIVFIEAVDSLRLKTMLKNHTRYMETQLNKYKLDVWHVVNVSKVTQLDIISEFIFWINDQLW